MIATPKKHGPLSFIRQFPIGGSVGAGQCVDLSERFGALVGLVVQTGEDGWNLRFNDHSGAQIPWHKYNPGDIPSPGDILNGAGGPYASKSKGGHTGVVVSAGAAGFTLLNQNYPYEGAPISISPMNYQYEGVLGWTHPPIFPNIGGAVQAWHHLTHKQYEEFTKLASIAKVKLPTWIFAGLTLSPYNRRKLHRWLMDVRAQVIFSKTAHGGVEGRSLWDKLNVDIGIGPFSVQAGTHGVGVKIDGPGNMITDAFTGITGGVGKWFAKSGWRVVLGIACVFVLIGAAIKISASTDVGKEIMSGKAIPIPV